MGNEQVRRIGRFYGIAGVIVIVFIAFFLVVENAVYVQSRHVYNQNMAAMDSMSQLNDQISEVNENVMLLVAGMGDESTIAKINESFDAIELAKSYYAPQSDMETRRFKQACYAIDAYQRKVTEVGERLMTARFETAHNIYSQEIEPLNVCASEMLLATVEIASVNSSVNMRRATMAHGIAQMSMILITIAGIIALFLAGRAQINRVLEMQLKEEELEEASDRLVASRKKLLDSAHLNILTGMQNRYGLEKRLGDILGTKQFYIAVLDVDNFRMVNDQYGYEYGDEYLIGIADRLKTQFSDRAELFNIYGNEFCLLFGDDVNDMQVKTLAEQARQSMGSNTQVAGMMLSSGVSGALYHVLPSENADVGGVLRKLDSAMHQAKADGGNRLYYL